MRKYRLICLKRSEFADRSNYEYHSDWWKASKIVYWRPNCRGYTSAPEGAGLYSATDLDQCAGDTGDWMIEPVNDVKIDVFQVSLRDF